MRVAIVHPWFPVYRERLFEEIIARAALAGISVQIFHGDVPPEWAMRGDVSDKSTSTVVPTKFIKLGPRALAIKDLREVRRRKFDVIVLEQAVRNLESYRLLLSRQVLAFWGHGKTFTQRSSRAQEALKSAVTRRGKWFFAYTPAGVEAVVSSGFPRSRTSVVMNSIDTRALLARMEISDPKTLGLPEDFRDGFNLLYIGGLDASKRLDFLFDAAREAHRLSPTLRLLVAGDGEQRSFVEEFVKENRWAAYLGRLDGEAKASAFALAKGVVMPGRVGLAAVDAIAASIPVITTNWPFHAPEFEYLINGANALVTENDSKIYAQALSDFVESGESLINPTIASELIREQLSVESAADNFVAGLVALREDQKL